ncbi:hypothetical protein J6590_091184 [Homalodisca vitripennis]|nr:hypothetical protein J6590_091184 [Homalodisca vitripennis]
MEAERGFSACTDYAPVPAGLFKSLSTQETPCAYRVSCVSDKYQLIHIEASERIQTRVLRILGRRLGVQYMDAPVAELRGKLNLAPLKK